MGRMMPPINARSGYGAGTFRVPGTPNTQTGSARSGCSGCSGTTRPRAYAHDLDFFTRAYNTPTRVHGGTYGTPGTAAWLSGKSRSGYPERHRLNPERHFWGQP